MTRGCSCCPPACEEALWRLPFCEGLLLLQVSQYLHRRKWACEVVMVVLVSCAMSVARHVPMPVLVLQR